MFGRWFMMGFAAVCALLVLVGLVAGELWALRVVLALLLLFVCFHAWQFARIISWLDDAQIETLPQAWGGWERVLDALYQMLRQQRKSQRKLTSALERFVAAAQAMPDGVVVLDEQDRIEWCNGPAVLHFGLDARKDRGQQITYLVRHPQFVAFMQNSPTGLPLLIRLGRDPEYVLSLQKVPFDVTGKLLLSRDVSQLERVQIAQRDFVANVSHELRTPLTVVGGFLETLLDLPGPYPAAASKYMPLMLEQTQRMQRIVNDLLTLSKIEDGRPLALDEQADIPHLMRLLDVDAQALSQGKHQISIDVQSQAHLQGRLDELHSAFGNLLSNAIRYTPAGGRIRLVWAETSDQLIFSVHDTGMGVPAEHIPRLTERFYRVDRARSRDTGGTGLGLAIVKQVLQRHHGQLDVQSQPNQGSVFSAIFPKSRMVRVGQNAGEEDGIRPLMHAETSRTH